MNNDVMIRIFHAEAVRFQTEMDRQAEMGRRIAGRTYGITRTALILLLSTGIIGMYFLWMLAGDVQTMARSMVSMYEHFGNLSQDMHTMTGSVTRMGGNVAGMTTIAEQMTLMNADMQQMERDVTAMHAHVGGMNGHLDTITAGVTDMSLRFYDLSHTVQFMGYNVNQMSQPVRTLDPFQMFRPW